MTGTFGLRDQIQNCSQGSFIAQKGEEKINIQAEYWLSDENVIEREFGAYENINDNYPKYVISLDPMTLSREGIIHKT